MPWIRIILVCLAFALSLAAFLTLLAALGTRPLEGPSLLFYGGSIAFFVGSIALHVVVDYA